MSAILINGKEMSEKVRAEASAFASGLKNKGIEPCLNVILVGNDPASEVYVRNKGRACEKAGIKEKTYKLGAETKESELLDLIDNLNADRNVHGILVQSPLASHLDEKKMFNRISPEKDVDGFHPVNTGRMVIGEDCLLPCTPAGIKEMLVRTGIETAGKHVVVVGRSNIVGKPMANIMLQKASGANSTVTIVHTGTKDPAFFTRTADILIVAAGRPDTITEDMIKEGAIVIDVGMNRVTDPSKKKGYRLCGDVDFDKVSEKASYITPVPGGVGPMTIAMLLSNTVKAAASQNGA
ncbi:MAG: bifunctional methylenetetrahydrofolate dehydrogenase/methenyltetrahydrofolate cyclohydrolase FolD [Fibrobacterota bacterium]